MKNRYEHFNSGRVNFFLLMTITVIVCAAVLKITSSIIVPFMLSLLLAIVFIPLVKYLAKYNVPRIVSVILVLIILMGGLFFMAVVLYSSGRTLLTLYPKYEARLTEIYIMVSRFFELPYDDTLSFFDNIWGQVGIRSRVRVLTLSFSNAFFLFMRDAFLVAIFMVFLLFEASFFREKLDRAFEGSRAEQIIKISSDLMTQVTRYLSIKFIISVINGLLAGIGLWIIGVEFAVVWGVVQFVLNFIPTIGSIAVGLMATAFALVQFWPAPGPIIATALVMLVVNLVCGYILDPKITGDRLGFSPLVILVSLMLWGYIWGFIGLIIAVPMMAIIKIVCENIPMLEPISILLGSHKVISVSKSEESGESIVKTNSDQPDSPEDKHEKSEQ